MEGPATLGAGDPACVGRLTDVIREIHTASRGTYGQRRVHAELTLGRGVTVGHGQVELVMRQAGIAGLSGRPTYRRVPNLATAADLVDRQFTRTDPDRLWVTDITEHPTGEGKVYCAVVLDVFSRLVVGWSIDSSATATLVTSALGMAIDRRAPDGTIIHSDQGTQTGFNRWSQHRLVGVSVGARRGLRLVSSSRVPCGVCC